MYQYSADVIKVIDGDTVDLSVDLGFSLRINERFRLLGINAPESRSSDALEKIEGLKAKHRLEEVLSGKKVMINTVMDKKEKYGRYLVEIFLPDINESVNQMMIGDGLAVPYFGGKR